LNLIPLQFWPNPSAAAAALAAGRFLSLQVYFLALAAQMVVLAVVEAPAALLQLIALTLALLAAQERPQ
jgi:hypothetical protein